MTVRVAVQIGPKGNEKFLSYKSNSVEFWFLLKFIASNFDKKKRKRNLVIYSSGWNFASKYVSKIAHHKTVV